MAATWAKRFRDGYDWAAAADIPKKYFSGSAGAQIATVDTRYNYGFGRKGGTLEYVVGANYESWRWSGAIRRGGATTENFIEILDGGSFQIIFKLLSSGVIEVYRGALATLLGSTAAVVPADDWLWCTVLVTIHNSAGVVKIFISNTTTPVLSLTGQDTQQTANAYADRVITTGDSTMWFDDTHIDAGSGTVVDADALPDSRIVTQFSLTQGDHSDFTPDSGTNHVNRVRDASGADGDSTYLFSNSAGDRESMLTDALPSDVDVINDVQVSAYHRKDDAAARTATLGTRRNGNDTDDPAGAVNVLDTYTVPTFCQAVDPETGVAWLPDDTDDTQIMYELTS